MNSIFPRLLKEPVLQFLILGGGLFAAYAAFAPPEEPPRETIVVTAERVESLSANFERTWRRSPTGQELDGLIEDYLAEELMYREALKIGLDRDDLIVRRRMRQKMKLLLADALAQAAPDEDLLRAFYLAEKERYHAPALLTFQQIHLKQNGDVNWPDLLNRINDDPLFDLAAFASPSLLPPAMDDATTQDIGRSFGGDFADAVVELPSGEWNGPVESSYGWHLVRVERATPGEARPFEEVREMVSRDFEYQRERETRAEVLKRLKENYDITIESPQP